jgi:hypothetical protein
VSGILLFPVALAQAAVNAYLGLLAFVVLPALMLLGLALIPVGIAISRRKRAAAPAAAPAEEERAALTAQAWQALFRFLAVTTVLNVIIGGYGAYSAVHYMETNAFCGQACHMMAPQATAIETGAHAGLDCVACHVGPGAAGFIEAKLGGLRQLLLMTTGGYARPIPGAADRMTPVAPRCEACHSQFREAGDTVRVLRSYYDDEANTPATSVLVMHTGKIHAAHGATDCLECHSRPAHTFSTAEAAVDRALADGSIARSLPFAKMQGIAILTATYESREQAAARIPEQWTSYYQRTYPGIWMERRAEVTGSGQALASIYAHNVFPDMNVGFGTYVSQLGHTATPGCFTCHDGTAATQDCSACHELAAVGEAEPAALTSLGLRP